MNARDRVLTAIDGGEPDCVPRAFNFYRVEIDKILPPGYLREDLVDVEFIRLPLSSEEEELSRIARPFPPDTRLGTAEQVMTYDQWNYRPLTPERRNPLARIGSLDDLRNFPFPDLSAHYHVEGLSCQVRDLHARGLAVGGNLPHLGGELFESAWRLRGLENFLHDLTERPDWAHFLLDRLTELACRNAATLAESGIDILALDDDVGMPGTMMMSPTTWRIFFKPRLARIIQTARANHSALRVLYHSDGHFEPIVGDLIEIGVNAINPLQPDHMDAARIRRRFGCRLALWGTVGSQTAFSFATPGEISREVKRRIETLGRKGLILCPAYDLGEPDISWQNIVAFIEAAERYG